MDRVRLGRVLGRGARLAARTAYEAVEAATAASPAGERRRVEVLTPRAVAQRPVASGRPGGGRLRPVVQAARAVSLEVTGSFFALFAALFGVGVWHERAQLHAGREGLLRFALFCGVAVFFAYCSVSNFRRARTR